MSRAVATFILLTLATACQSVPFPEYTKAVGDASPNTTVAKRAGFQCTLRAVLTLSGNEVVFTIYGLSHGHGNLRMVAVADIGGTMFDVSLSDGYSAIHQGSPVLGDDFIANHLVRDFAEATREQEPDRSIVVKLADGSRATLHTHGPESVLYQLAPARDKATVYRGVSARLESTATIDFVSSGIPEGAMRPSAFTITSADKAWSMQCVVVDWSPIEAATVQPNP